MRKEPGKSWSSSCIRSVFQRDGGFWFLAMLTGTGITLPCAAWPHMALGNVTFALKCTHSV